MFRLPLRGAAGALTLAGALWALPVTPPKSTLPTRTLLKDSYRLRLTSTWPQLVGPVESCVNGGEETIEGVLHREADGTYRGDLTRRTLLRFCGAHGAASESCSLSLSGQGTVRLWGDVVGDERSPTGRALRAHWVPADGHRAEISGDCPPSFGEAVERMYLEVRHGAEFSLTGQGAGPRVEMLSDYPWTVELD
ncbi:MAG: hypothetical protein ACREMG_04605 [Gemmatimonadales bacterium]